MRHGWSAAWALAATACGMMAAGCNFRTRAVAEPEGQAVRAPVDPVDVPAPDPAAVQTPEGFTAEVVATGLVYPSSLVIDDDGNLLIAEAGWVYADHWAIPRILRITPEGDVSVYAAEGLSGPITDLLWHGGRLFVSHRTKVSEIDAQGRVRDLVTGLPSLGDHQNNQLAAGPDGRLYLGQGTATNSGIVGLDNVAYLWLPQYPDFHDQLAEPVQLAGERYTTANPFILAGGEFPEISITGAFQPFGTSDASTVDAVADRKANGTILSFRPDGSDLRVVAWGLRNPFGVTFGNDGQLYASENGYDERGSRPIANDGDNLYAIEQGSWYGWPDFADGLPVTDPRFKPEDGPRPEFVMAEHPPLSPPLMRFPQHAGVTKLAASPGGAWGDPGDLFMAVWGHMTPLTGHIEGEHFGHQVVRINPQARRYETFLSNRGHGHGRGHGDGHAHSDAADGDQVAQIEVSAGLRRPMDVAFSPDGQAMYVVDLGVMPVLATKIPLPMPMPGTGVVWRIVPEGVEIDGPPANIHLEPASAAGRPQQTSR